MSSSSSNVSASHHSDALPLKEIPGSYGLPFFGPLKDRLDYYYNQGQHEFFSARMKKYNSTVFRVNAPPGPFTAKDSRVIVLLDAVSYPVLFDNSKVDKANIFTGTFVPSTDFNGGYRICVVLDPSEPKHEMVKSFFLSILARLHKKIIPSFRDSVSRMFDDLDADFAEKGEASFNSLSDKMSFDFLFRLFGDKSSYETSLGGDGNSNFDKWLFIQLAPLMTLGLKFVPNCVEDLFLHTFRLPSFLARSGYEKIRAELDAAAAPLLDEAEELGLTREEASHNLMFMTGFNSYGGMKILYPVMLKYVGLAGEELHRRLAAEVRSAVSEEGGVTLAAIEKMSLLKSAVWEALRMEPPVQFQYARAKMDLTVTSHDASHVIKKGETICGFQPLATKDPKIFSNSSEYVADRFVGDGEKMLKYVYWSNAKEVDSPSAGDKQCPAKNMVLLVSRLILVEFFLRYDTFSVEVGQILQGPAVTFKSLTKVK